MNKAKLRSFGWILAVLMLMGGSAAAQTTEADLSARLKDKPLFLMGLWDDDNLKFDAHGHPAGNYQTTSFTVCGVHVTKVTLNGGHLKLEGEREGLVFEKQGTIKGWATLLGEGKGLFKAPKPEKLSIEIDNGNDPDFGPALDAVLGEDLSRLGPLLPDFWQLYFKTHLDTQSTPAQPQSSSPAKPKSDAMHIGGSVQPPKLIHQVEAGFSKYARQNKISGNVQLYLWVNEDGTPSHVRIIRPLGLGLDEEAVAAVKQYRFSPAMQNGKPVKVDLYIDVNFQIF